MARRGSGFGFVMLLVVVAAALLLAAKAWQRSGSAALALDPESAVSGSGAPDEAREARDTLTDLPDLGAMRDATSRHSDAVQEALAATEE